jgi:hypothetical protein
MATATLNQRVKFEISQFQVYKYNKIISLEVQLVVLIVKGYMSFPLESFQLNIPNRTETMLQNTLVLLTSSVYNPTLHLSIFAHYIV